MSIGDDARERLDAPIEAYLAAAREPSGENLAALTPYLARGVVVELPRGTWSGSDAAGEALRSPPATALHALLDEGTSWAVAAGAETGLTLSVVLPDEALARALTFTFKRRDGRLTHVIERADPPVPLSPGPIVLTERIKGLIRANWDAGVPVAVAYVDATGAPRLSFRGSIQPFGDDALAFWSRSPAGGLVTAIATNPQIGMIYRNPQEDAVLECGGFGTVSDDPEVRRLVFEGAPQGERAADPERKGVPVLVRLDRIEGFVRGARINMRRELGGSADRRFRG